jgi:hypothetical protein
MVTPAAREIEYSTCQRTSFRRRKSYQRKDPEVFISSSAPPLRLQTCYVSQKREIAIYVVREAPEEKAHGASGWGLSSSRGS